MTSHTPNTVFYQVGQSPIGKVVVFCSRLTGAHFPENTDIQAVPGELKKTVVHGVSNMPLIYTFDDLTDSQIKNILNNIGFIERPSNMEQAHLAPRKWTPPAPAPVMEPADLAFSIGTRMAGPDGKKPIVMVSIRKAGELDYWESEILNISLIPSSITKNLVFDPKHGFLFEQKTEEEGRAVLLGMGLTERGPMGWLFPQDLYFGVNKGTDIDGSPLAGSTYLFILPKDKDADFFDNLGEDNLQTCPDFIGSTDCENTWTIEDMSPQKVKSILIGLGYTHDPELDGYWGT